jgi:hypothetical protein
MLTPEIAKTTNNRIVLAKRAVNAETIFMLGVSARARMPDQIEKSGCFEHFSANSDLCRKRTLKLDITAVSKAVSYNESITQAPDPNLNG